MMAVLVIPTLIVVLVAALLGVAAGLRMVLAGRRDAVAMGVLLASAVVAEFLVVFMAALAAIAVAPDR